HLVDDGLWVGVAVFELLRAGNDFLVDELPHSGDDLGLELGKSERLRESGHEMFPLCPAQPAIVLALVRRAMSCSFNPRRSVSTSMVSWPRFGAGAHAG